ncbi:MAG: hypothetical protein IPJ88_08335 [Myxococcales bacterium]|nr:MAG: hypothetical protein IPJ88_08335 [Myxococcales bacterium]
MKFSSALNKSIAIALSLWALAGCSAEQNAILEVQLTLPPYSASGAEELYALIQFRWAENNPFSVEWEGSDPAGVRLEANGTVSEVSVVADSPEGDVNLRVKFCANPTCTALGDDLAAESRFVLENPLYIGERTFWSATIASIPSDKDSEALIVDKCDIEGCLEGEASSYCRNAGTHFCE